MGGIKRTRVFISYRRADAEVIAGRLRDRLRPRCRVFMDEYEIDGGDGLRGTIRAAISKTDILLVLVSPAWADRLHDGGDYVRWEIELAAEHQCTIVVVRHNDAELPLRGDLPGTIRFLADNKWFSLRDSDFEVDLRKILSLVRRPLWPFAAGVATMCVAVPAIAWAMIPNPAPRCGVGEASREEPVELERWCKDAPTSGVLRCAEEMPDEGRIDGRCRDGQPDGAWVSLDASKKPRWSGTFAGGARTGDWSMPVTYRGLKYPATVGFHAGLRSRTKLVAGKAEITLTPRDGADDTEEVTCGAAKLTYEPERGTERIALRVDDGTIAYAGTVQAGKPIGTWTVRVAGVHTDVNLDQAATAVRIDWTNVLEKVVAVRDCTGTSPGQLPRPECPASWQWSSGHGCVLPTSGDNYKGACSRESQTTYTMTRSPGCPPASAGAEDEILRHLQVAHPGWRIECTAYFDCLVH